MLQSDGTLIRENVIDDGVLYGRLIQPDRNLILDRNAELQKNPDALRRLESMGWELSIPLQDYHQLRSRNPDLKSPDATVRTRAWQAFIGSAESVPYRVRTRVHYPS